MANPYCEHNAMSASAQELRATVHEILGNFGEKGVSSAPVAHLSHVHPGPGCDDTAWACDSASRVACYPTPEGASFVCVHAVEVPTTSRSADVVESIIACIEQTL